MPTTRSANKQAKLEDVGVVDKDAAGPANSKASAGQKRKADSLAQDAKGKAKKSKQVKSEDEQEDDYITINRAPVLELWASCVAQFLHPSLSWNTALSIGGAISTITAISKGRSIGTMEKPDPGEAQRKKEKREEAAEKGGLKEVEVMSFHLNLDDNGQALVGGKPKKGNEDALRKKYGGPEQYDKVRTAFQDSLQSWKGKEEELDKQSFGFYEDFRPSIPLGQKGWGRKGQLRLETVKQVVDA